MQMEDEHNPIFKNKRNRRIKCFAVLFTIVIAFVIGFVIGFFVKKSSSDTRADGSGENVKKSAFQGIQDEIKKHHEHFREVISAKQLEENVQHFSEKPHIAGSDQQKILGKDLAKRWENYGFDHVEMPKYTALLSFPDRTKNTTITIKYKNGSTIHQVKATEQEEGSSEKGKDIIQPFLGYSPSGRAEGELVYVNYGRVEDFEKLKNLIVNVTGKIAIMRYGAILRGNKIANAARYGAKAALLYSDPADYALLGGDLKNTYPNTAWLPPSGVQRGSLYTGAGGGDPQTPGLPALDGMYRRPYNESQLPPIPAHPMGYGDAIHFLSRMAGPEAPKEWRGTLGITYRLGPDFTNSDITVEVDINNKLQELPIYNVIGTIHGHEEPDRYVLIGNHRDSWVNGAVDAVSGTAVMTEIARGLGELRKSGWRPRRTIKFCSWAAEEYALIGSVEWVEEHEKVLFDRAVMYLNADSAVAGSYVLSVGSSPLLEDNILQFSKTVQDPNAHGDKQSIFDVMLDRTPSNKNPEKPVVGSLGSGSDYASFYQFVGVPSMDFTYMFNFNNSAIFYPVYHSQHDTFEMMKKFIDPEFKIHHAVSQLCGVLLLHYADTPLLDMSVSLYAKALKSSLNGLKANPKLKSGEVNVTVLEDAVTKFYQAAAKFNDARSQVQKKLQEFEEPQFGELRRLNDQMIQVERAFIYPYGLPGRSRVRHVLFAPALHNVYGSSSFPGVNDVLFDVDVTRDWDEVNRQISIAAQAVLSAVDILTPYEDR